MSSISSFSPVTTREQAYKFLEAQGGQMLAPELIIAFMFKMDLSSVSAFSLTCKYINVLSKDEILWQRLISEHFSMNPAHEITPSNPSYLEAYKKLKIFHSNLSNGVYSQYFFVRGEKTIEALVVAEDKLFSNAGNHTIIAFDKETGTLIRTFEGHELDVSSLVVAEDKLISGSWDETIKVWEIETGHCINTLRGHTGTIAKLVAVTNKLYSSSWDKTIKVWDIESGACIQTFEGHTKGVCALVIDDDVLYSGDSDGIIKEWDAKTGQCINTFDTQTNGISTLHMTDTKLVYGTFDGEIKVWDKKTGDCINTPEGKDREIKFLNTFGNKLLSISYCNIMNIWNLETGEYINEFQDRKNFVHSSAVVGSKIYLGHANRTISVLDFDAPHKMVFEEIASLFVTYGYAEEAMKRFLRMPEKARMEIYGELYAILNDSVGCAEDAFHDAQEQSSTPEQKALAIQNYLKKSALG